MSGAAFPPRHSTTQRFGLTTSTKMSPTLIDTRFGLFFP